MFQKKKNRPNSSNGGRDHLTSVDDTIRLIEVVATTMKVQQVWWVWSAKPESFDEIIDLCELQVTRDQDRCAVGSRTFDAHSYSECYGTVEVLGRCFTSLQPSNLICNWYDCLKPWYSLWDSIGSCFIDISNGVLMTAILVKYNWVYYSLKWIFWSDLQLIQSLTVDVNDLFPLYM